MFPSHFRSPAESEQLAELDGALLAVPRRKRSAPVLSTDGFFSAAP